MSEHLKDRYAVVGNPVEHSKSPDIHLLFADQTGEQLHYEKILVEEYDFKNVVNAFFDNGGKGLLIANRTVNKATTIANMFKAFGEVASCGLNEIPKQNYDLILHATSAGLQGNAIELPSEIIGPNSCCYDLLYSDEGTPFTAWAKSNNAGNIVDGFGMLLEQAAEAFYIWRGIRPDTGMAYHYFRPTLAQKPSL